jgi:CheY-like chemotaxis protein
VAPKIVVVDDEEDHRTLLRLVLERQGYVVLDAEDGQAGLKIIEKVRPDLAIIDMIMPKMNGYELVVALQKNPALKKTAIIVLTSLTQDSQRSDEDWRARMDIADFITKPYEPSELVERVGKILAQRAAGD